MKRFLFGAVAVTAALLLLAPAGWAHGGSFRGPGDQVPPGLREPSDPTPPPPPPPSGPPETPSPVTPTPGGPPPPTPEAPTPVTPNVPTPEIGGERRGPRRTQLNFESWIFWYENNKDDIELLKEALYHKLSSNNPLFGSGDTDAGSRGSRTRRTEKAVLEDIIPALRWAMDPKNAGHQDTESASYIALAKIAKTPDEIQLIQGGLDLQADHDQIVMESAALALGLLARAHEADQFAPRELDGVRDFLFEVFENDKYPNRTRTFAMFGLGLLGGQPTGSGSYADNREAAAKATTARLFELLKGSYPDQDLYVGIMTAIGLQSPKSVVPEQREVLADCALKGRLYRDEANAIIRSDAALALGRIGVANDRKTLEQCLTSRRVRDLNIRRSAAIGLGLLGRQVAGEERVDVAKSLLKGMERAKDNSTQNFAIISLAYLLTYDIQAGTSEVFDGTKVTDTLLEIATDGTYTVRPFGALACGLVAREVSRESEVDAYQSFKEKAVNAIREGLQSTKMDKRGQAAFCVAAGIAKDSGSREALRTFVEDRKEDKQLRGYAAIGLGLIGEPTPNIVKAIAEAMLERSSEDLRRQTAVALGLLNNPQIPDVNKDAVDLLREELKEAKSQAHKGQVVIALAGVGDDRAAEVLIDLLKDTKEKDLTRALACAGLGIIGDLEKVPTLARLSKHVNYRASSNARDEVLSIL